MPKLAFCNDCDRLEWPDYLEMHAFLDELRLPAGDSFWLFDPLGISDMALFRNDVATKARNHDNLLAHLKSGQIDTLHGIGLFGKTGDDYVYPDRDEIRRAFDYLEDHGCTIRMYVSHGNIKHVHNIPKHPRERRYQCGDLPFSKHYILDIAAEYGVQYYWNSDLRQGLATPYRTTSPAVMPDGRTVTSFARNGVWGCGAHTFVDMLAPEMLEQAVRFDQNLVLFSHWGMPGLHSPTPDEPLLNHGVREAFHRLADLRDAGEVEVVRLGELLDADSELNFADEMDRIRAYHPLWADAGTDAPSSAYVELADSTGLKGHRVLDATGERGLTAMALARRFAKVLCAVRSESEREAAEGLAEAMGLRDVTCLSPDTPEPADNSLDAVFCRASELARHPELLGRYRRMLGAGMPLCVFLDALSDEELQARCRDAGYRTFDSRPGSARTDGFLGDLPRFFAAN